MYLGGTIHNLLLPKFLKSPLQVSVSPGISQWLQCCNASDILKSDLSLLYVANVDGRMSIAAKVGHFETVCRGRSSGRTHYIIIGTTFKLQPAMVRGRDLPSRVYPTLLAISRVIDSHPSFLRPVSPFLL